MEDTSRDFVQYIINNNNNLINDFALIEAQKDFKKSIDERYDEAKAVRQNEQTQEVYSNYSCVFSYCPHPELCKATKNGCSQL